jgi:hypothetical protein
MADRRSASADSRMRCGRSLRSRTPTSRRYSIGASSRAFGTRSPSSSSATRSARDWPGGYVPEGKLFELQDTISRRRVAERFRIDLRPGRQRTLGPSEQVPYRIMEQYFAARARLLCAPSTVADEREQIVASFDPIVEQAPNFARVCYNLDTNHLRSRKG